jgi:hypothetical protein
MKRGSKAIPRSMAVPRTTQTTLNLPAFVGITVSSSSRFYDSVRHVKSELERLGFRVSTPDLDFDETKRIVDESTKYRLTFDFLEKIKRSDILLIVTDEQGYVGRSVSLEVGFAYALGLQIYSLHPVAEPAIACLSQPLPSLEQLLSQLGVVRS